MKLLIPVKVQERVQFSIERELEFINLNQKQKQNLNKTLISLWYFIYNKQRNDESLFNLKGYTNIYSDDLQIFYIKLNNKKFGYKQLLTMLEGVNLISINEKYSKGKFPQGYRIETDIISLDYTEIEIDFDKIFSNVHNKEYWIKKYQTSRHRIKDIYETKIELSEYILWLIENSGLELKPVIKNGVLHTRFLTEERIFDYINDALKLNYENIWFKISDEGRFYNTTTNLSYTALPFLRLKRRRLLEVDVVNCQPLLLCGLIKNIPYKNAVENGVFYDEVAKELNITRNQFKVLSYKHIFFSKKQLNGGKIYNALEKLYPGFILEMNELRNTIEVSKEMQKLESDIFIKKISKLDFKMITRHDAVFVYEEDYEIVKNYVIQEFKNIGLRATIK